MELPITKDQAFFLNTLGRTAQLYRSTNERMQRDLTENLARIEDGKAPSAVRAGEAADLMTASAQIESMTAIVYAVFPFPAPQDRQEYMSHVDMVNGYLKAALTLEPLDYILMKH